MMALLLDFLAPLRCSSKTEVYRGPNKIPSLPGCSSNSDGIKFTAMQVVQVNWDMKRSAGHFIWFGACVRG